MLRGAKERAGGSVPAIRTEALEEVAALSRCIPAGLVPAVAHNGNHVDQRPALDRVMHKMGVAAEPENDGGSRELGRRRCGGGERAPGAMACKPRLVSVSEALTQSRPQAVGADQQHAVLLARFHP